MDKGSDLAAIKCFILVSILAFIDFTLAFIDLRAGLRARVCISHGRIRSDGIRKISLSSFD